MHLQGRQLTARMQGDDVAMLHRELLQLRFEIPGAERQQRVYGEATQRAVMAFQEQHGLRATGVVDEVTAAALGQAAGAAPPGRFVVRGQVLQADGSPLAGGVVYAVDKDLRHEQPLGQAVTDAAGRYEIHYTAEQFSRAEKRSADLAIRVARQGQQQPVDTPVHFNAPAVATIDVTIRGGPAGRLSEIERYVQALLPLLQDVQVEGVEQPTLLDKLADLKEDQDHREVTFVSRETGIAAEHIGLLVLAAQLSRRTHVPLEAHYGALRQGLPVRLWALALVSPRRLRSALERSLRDNLIPASTAGELDRILEMLRQVLARQLLEPGQGQSSMGDLLRTAALPAHAQEIFTRRYLEHEGPIEDFWQALREEPGFGGDRTVDDIQFSLQAALLAQNCLPVIAAVQDLRRDGQLESLRDLARLDAAGWQRLIDEATAADPDALPPHLPGATREERLGHYAESILETLRAAFPTAFVAQGIARGPVVDRTLIRRVLAQNPELDPGEPLPDDINWSGLDDAEQVEARASLEQLRREINMFPGLDYRQALESSGDAQPARGLANPLRQAVARFFENRPDFDLAGTHVDTYLAEHAATAFAGIPEPQRAAVTEQLKAMQRVYRVVPRYEHMQALMGEGLHSAFDVATMPQSAFIELCGAPLGGDMQARAYHAGAQQITSTHANVFAGAYQNQFDVTPFVIGGGLPKVQQDPEWTGLFGGINLCDCEHCRSVYSPAAYFVDLLQFLNPKSWNSKLGPKRPLNVLLERRPDLEHIQLTCENTNTPLPYADLVNEILEYYVVHGALAPAAARNTEGITAQELSAHPQYTIAAAYEKLKERIYPFTLPFDQPLEIARTYLEHLGGNRYQIMDAFQRDGQPSAAALACEYLGISPRERQILTGVTPQNQPFTALHQYYGYSNPVGWLEDIAWVPRFLERTGIHYTDLIQLLATRFVNPDQTLQRVLVSDEVEPSDLCDLDKIRIEPLDAAALERIHRFLRLWRKLGWSIGNLDRALAALQITAIDDPALQKIAVVKRLERDLKQPLAPLLSLWANIDTHGWEQWQNATLQKEDSLYAQLFQNKAVLNPVDAAFALNPAGTELLDTTQALSDHVPAILAALRIRASDLEAIRHAAGLDDDLAANPPVQAPLNLAALSALYRVAVLARALKLPVKDVPALKDLAGIDPFAPASPAGTEAFVKTAQKVRDSGFSVALLDYLYRDHAEPVSNLPPAQAQVELLREQLQAGLQKIVEETTAVPDPQGEFLRGKLAMVLDPTLVEVAMTLIDGASQLSDAEKTDFIQTHFASFVDPAEAGPVLLAPLSADPPVQEEQRQARRAFILAHLLDYLRDTLSRSLVKQTLSDALSLEAALAALLLETVLHAQSDPSAAAIADFLALAESATPAVLDAAHRSYRLLHKVSLLVNALELTAAEVAYLAAHSADFAGFDLNALPLQPAAAAPGLFAQWERLADLVALRNALPKAEVRLIDVFAAAAAGADPNALSAAVTGALVAATGWDEQELLRLAGPQSGFGLADDDFRDERWPVRLQECLRLGRRLGVSVGKLFEWTETEPDAAQAEDIVNTVKAKYDETQWLSIARPLNDVLRERRKDALVAYVLAEAQIIQKGITDSNQLFEYFLVDVEIDACMLTSRIKQAISSVQLFIQRCLMNLEPQVSPVALDAQQWLWMKNYRVWEANRKVFLYPENWILPELRDDKSPFFRELETELLQDEVTTQTAERALLHYLEKLDEVARLEIVGMAGQPVGGGDDAAILHVFARSFNPPHRYFYRRYLAATGTWTPWETVNLDIPANDDGVHVIPVVYNERLYLCWPVFKEKENSSSVPPTQSLEIRLAWSEFQRGKWTAKKISTGVPLILQVTVPGHPPVGEYKNHIAFHTSTDADGDLVLLCSATGTQYAYSDQRVLERVRLGEFRLDACDGRMQAQYPLTYGADAEEMEYYHASADRKFYVPLPMDDAYVSYMNLLEWGSYNGRYLLTGSYAPGDSPQQAAEKTTPVEFFGAAAGKSSLLFSPHDGYFTREPFVFSDDLHAYAALPAVVPDLALYAPYLVLAEAIDPKLVLQSTAALGTGSQSGMTTQTGAMHPVSGSSGTGVIVAAQPAGSLGMSHIGAMKPISSATLAAGGDLRFVTFFHPHVCTWIKAVNRNGLPGEGTPGNQPVDALLTLDSQQLDNDAQLSLTTNTSTTVFKETYAPVVEVVDPDYPREDVDFGPDGAYSLYNWELFFHAPMLVAMLLSQGQRFEDAQRWFHYIFNPTDNSQDPSPRRYWKVLPFYQNAHPEEQQIQVLLEALSYKGTNAAKLKKKAEVDRQVQAWRKNPFNPHLIARLRITAYQKNVVMRYIDTVIAWADQLFRRETIESINQATQLYVLAANMLGERPERIPPAGTVAPETYASLKTKQIDSFSNALVQMETDFPIDASGGASGGTGTDVNTLKLGTTFYFCIPQNDKLLSYWDTVADRLFKIRHCMNIEGIVRQLPLFEPPIDPALLVKAFALGVDINSILNDLNAPLPHYRFAFLLQKALELCGEVKALGQALLSTLEKKDAEALASLRATHETGLLRAVREVKTQQIEEAKVTREGLQKTRDVTEERRNFYRDIEFTNPAEKTHLALSPAAAVVEAVAEGILAAAGSAHTAPTGYVGGITGGMATGPIKLDSVYSGAGAGHAGEAAAKGIDIVAKLMREGASLAQTLGSYHRRWAEWKLQERLGNKELLQIDKQIAAAQIRELVAEQDLENHDKQIDQASEVEEFLRDKYTNQELYTWMVAQISAVFFQSYKLAYDVARRAERAYQFERGLTGSSFIQFGYWDSLRNGLLSGERLYLDLKRMEGAYLEQNKREYELTRQISLVLHDPMALINLKETGQCVVRLPEALFDMDYPGHYMRRIKSVSLTIPCVTGPYTGINCTLTLLSNKVRIDGSAQQPYAEQDGDTRFVANFAALQSVATSHAQNDSGLFELSFRDERYLPFEGAGVDSTWRIEMPRECNAFDFDTIADVIMKINYTARDGGALLRKLALEAAVMPESPDQGASFAAPGLPAQEHLQRLFSARHEFPSEWHRFLHPNDTDPQHTLQMTLTPERFPYRFRGKTITAGRVHLFLKLKDGASTSGGPLAISLTPPDGQAVAPAPELASVPLFLNGMPHAVVDLFGETMGPWQLQVAKADLAAFTSQADAIEDILLVYDYGVS